MWLFLQIVCLAGIAFFDFKDRSIPVLLFVSSFILATWHFYGQWWFWPQVLINLALAGIQIVLIATWFKIRKREVSFFNEAFGWGDVLMMAIGAFYFTPIHFMLFIVGSAVVSLIYAVVIKWIRTEQQVFIPLAGIMALLLAGQQLFVTFKP